MFFVLWNKKIMRGDVKKSFLYSLPLLWPFVGDFIFGLYTYGSEVLSHWQWLVDSLGERLFHDASAVRTHLGCVSGIDLNEVRTSTFSLVREVRIKSSPRRTVDTSPEPARFAVLFQILDIQVFNTDRRIGVNVLTGEFVQEIVFLVGDMIIDLLQFPFCLLPVLREPLFPGKTPLDLLDPAQRMFIEPGVLDHCTVTIDRKRVQTEIDTDRLPFTL